MDGTRMGSRSSTRHGPAAVFSGPVRRWRKAWAPVTSSSSSASTSSSSSRVHLYKWVPLTAPGGKDEAPEELTPPTIRYMPVSIVLAQRKEASKASEEVEAATETVADDSDDPDAQADATDYDMVSPETKVWTLKTSEVQLGEKAHYGVMALEKVDAFQTSDSAGIEEQVQPADTKDVMAPEGMVDNCNSPGAEGDVTMTDKEQDKAEEVKPAEQGPSGLDLESAQVPSDSSAGSEPEN